MSYSNCVCRKCGKVGQGNVEYNSDTNDWLFHCFLCSHETLIPKNQIPPELQRQRYKYSDHVLKSCGAVAQGNFPKYQSRSE